MILRKAIAAAAIIGASMAAQADTFAERWPIPVAADPVIKPAPPPQHIHKTRACHRVYYTKRKYRHWRCRK